MKFTTLLASTAIVSAEPIIVELFLGKPTEGVMSEQLYALNEDQTHTEDDYLDQLSAIDACDPSESKCQVYSLVQMDDGQLAIVNLGWWEDLQKNVKNTVSKIGDGIKNAVKVVKSAGSAVTKFVKSAEPTVEGIANVIQPGAGAAVRAAAEAEEKANDFAQSHLHDLVMMPEENSADYLWI